MKQATRATVPLARAAGAVIVDAERRVLLVQQASGHRRWGLPGTHLQPCDVPSSALVRDVRREIGLETEVTGLVGLYHLAGGDLPDLLTYVFACDIVGGEPVVNERGRIARIGWHDAGAVPPPVTVTARAVGADLVANRHGVVRDLTR